MDDDDDNAERTRRVSVPLMTRIVVSGRVSRSRPGGWSHLTGIIFWRPQLFTVLFTV